MADGLHHRNTHPRHAHPHTHLQHARTLWHTAKPPRRHRVALAAVASTSAAVIAGVAGGGNALADTPHMVPAADKIPANLAHDQVLPGPVTAAEVKVATTPPPPPPPAPQPATVSIASASTPATVPTPKPTTTTTSQPVSTTTVAATSSGGTDLGSFEITCYALRGTTADGDQAGPESAAVDPSVIPLGTHLYISGIGNRVADDTGGAIRGHHIDVWESSNAACESYGVQYHDVHRV